MPTPSRLASTSRHANSRLIGHTVRERIGLTMRRVNIEAAFLGEGGVSDTGDEEGLALSVRGGEIVLVLPADTPESKGVDAALMVGASRRREAGGVLTFEIHDGGVGAFFEDEPGELFDRREASPADGVSSV